MGYRQVGEKGAWKNTMAAVSMNNGIYSIEADGKLYVTRQDGSYTALGDGYGGTRFLMASGGKVYTIDADGTAWEVDV